MAVVERLRPRPTAKTKLRSDSVSPTVATASAPKTSDPENVDDGEQ
jgi:hypothetical protein